MVDMAPDLVTGLATTLAISLATGLATGLTTPKIRTAKAECNMATIFDPACGGSPSTVAGLRRRRTGLYLAA
jgi:hypothetical protein